MASQVERRKCEIGDVNVRINVLAALIKHATKRQTLGMKRLVDICHLDPKDRLSFVIVQDALDVIFEWCLVTKYPMLTSLVVFQSGGKKGLPSESFWHLVENYRQAKDFSPDDSIRTADRFTQETFLRYQHIQCFNHYNSLVTHVTQDRLLPATMSDRLGMVAYTVWRTLEEVPGFQELTAVQDSVLRTFIEAQPDPESFVHEMIETITSDENFINGKQRRAFETFIISNNIQVSDVDQGPASEV